MSNTDVKKSLDAIINGLCASRRRHDRLITNCVRDTVQNPTGKSPLHDFADYLARRLMKNESVVVNSVTVAALFSRSTENIPDNALQLLQHYLKRQPFERVLESQPILNLATKQPILLVISRHAFRVMEITLDISRVLNPDMSPEMIEKNDYLANVARVTENLLHMGPNYGPSDIIDCLHLISERGAFYLRAGFLFTANIEPKPFSETLEQKGFHVSFLLDDTETDEKFEEHDFIKRLRGLLITKSMEEMERALTYIDFLEELTRYLPLPPAQGNTLNLG
jgi:hypothetical protein